jgi:serine protease Do
LKNLLRKSERNMKKYGLTLLTAFIGGAMALGTYKLLENKYADNMSFQDKQKVYFASNPQTPITSSAGEVDFTQAAAMVTPAVVYIRTTYAAQQGGDQSELQRMFGDMFGQQPNEGVQMASGSGVIISPDGYIVTNNHVVEKAEKITVNTNDHRQFQAKVIGTDPNTDLALIKIEATNLPIVKLGNSDDTKVGEWVLAVGNPFNLTSTVTAGIISAKGRNIGIIGHEDQEQNPFAGRMQRGNPQGVSASKAIESFIQTDAAINPGNSGGALVNTRGELVGINSAIASQTGSYEGYGFAIPINLAKKVLNDIQKYGAVKRGFVGVSFTELTPDNASDLKTSSTSGLYVRDLVPSGGAEQAGIKPGDVIVKVDGNPVYQSSDLEERVGELQPGDKLQLTVLRDGTEKNFNVTLKADVAAPRVVAEISKSASELFNKLGASFMPVSQEQKAHFHINSGLVVTQVRPGRLFDDTEIPVGSVITRINRQSIASTTDMDNAITNTRNGLLVISGFYPDGTSFSNTFQVQ